MIYTAIYGASLHSHMSLGAWRQQQHGTRVRGSKLGDGGMCRGLEAPAGDFEQVQKGHSNIR